MEKYLDERDDLQAGRVRRFDQEMITTLRDVANQFLSYKKSLVGSGELSNRTFNEYLRDAESVLKSFGPERDVNDIRPEEFTNYRVQLSKERGLHSLGKEIRITRMMFLFAQARRLDRKSRTVWKELQATILKGNETCAAKQTKS